MACSVPRGEFAQGGGLEGTLHGACARCPPHADSHFPLMPKECPHHALISLPNSHRLPSPSRAPSLGLSPLLLRIFPQGALSQATHAWYDIRRWVQMNGLEYFLLTQPDAPECAGGADMRKCGNTTVVPRTIIEVGRVPPANTGDGPPAHHLMLPPDGLVARWSSAPHSLRCPNRLPVSHYLDAT